MSIQPTVPSTTEDLKVRFGEPHELAAEHRLSYIDEAAERFLAQCPFVIVSTADAEGRCDASPKGDPPGFIHVADKHTVYLPDRAGNKMFQSIGNILSNPYVGLLFLIPGEEWTMRINGRARIVDDQALMDKLSARGRPAQMAIKVEVEECYFHCPKSFKRAELWNTEQFHKYQGDSWGTILAQRTKLAKEEAEQLDNMIEESVKDL
jgi:PPOX class probable FMN-dependent enzyme